MSNVSIILTFTQQFADLLACGVPMRQAARQLGAVPLQSARIRHVCDEIGTGLEDGRTLSSVLASCTRARFPRWYTAFVSAAEENNCITETLCFLAQTLRVRRQHTRAFVGALVYPLVVVVLCALCSVWAALRFPYVFPADDASAGGVYASFVLSSLFLLAVVFFTVLLAKAVLAVNPCISLMNALAFLTTKGTSLSDSLECAIPVVEKHERLCDAVLTIRERLLSGENVESVFSEQLEAAGFSSADLALAQSGVARNVFAETASALVQKAEKVRASVLSCEQPVLLCCAAVYMLILLRQTLMPYITHIGG